MLQLICVYVESDNEDVGKSVSEYFGVTGDAPTVSFPQNSFISMFFFPAAGLLYTYSVYDQKHTLLDFGT